MKYIKGKAVDEKIRNKISEIIRRYPTHIATTQILALFPSLDGIVVEEECQECNGWGDGRFNAGDGDLNVVICAKCHGTGTTTRQAAWNDLQYLNWNKFSIEGYVTTKSGGRLKVKNDNDD